MFQRMLLKQALHSTEGNRHKFISWDALVFGIIELYVKQKLVQLESLATDMRLFCKDKHESRQTFEDFCYSIEKSDHYGNLAQDREWTLRSFTKLLENSENENTKIEQMIGNIVDDLEGFQNLPSNEFFIPLIFMINSCRFMTADERTGQQRVLAYINQMFNPTKPKKNVKKKKEGGMTAQEKTKAKEDEQII